MRRTSKKLRFYLSLLFLVSGLGSPAIAGELEDCYRGDFHVCSKLIANGTLSSGSAVLVFQMLAKTSYVKNEREKALAFLSAALQVDANSAETLALRAFIRAESPGSTQDLAGARADADRAMTLKPDSVDVRNSSGQVYLATREHRKAIDDFTRSLELYDRQPIIYWSRGTAWARLEKFAEARSDLAKAHDFDPQNVRIANELARIQFRFDDFSGAVNVLTGPLKTGENSKEFSEAYNARGYAFLALGKPEQALQDLASAFVSSAAVAPYNILVNRCVAHLQLRRLREAETDCSKAIEADAKVANAYRFRAGVLFETGDVKRGMLDLERAIEIDNTYAAALVVRGEQFEKQGLFQRAAQDYSAALEKHVRHGNFDDASSRKRATEALVRLKDKK